jgi:hypothetical protein
MVDCTRPTRLIPTRFLSILVATFAALTALATLALAPSPASAQTVTLNGCNGPPFGNGCSLEELELNNGSLVLDLPNANPAVRVIFENFDIGAKTFALGTPTDYGLIQVTLEATATPSLIFEDRSEQNAGQWEVTAAKRDVITYQVRLVDFDNPGTPVAGIRGAGLHAEFPIVRLPASPEPAEGRVRDRTTPAMIGGNLNVFRKPGSDTEYTRAARTSNEGAFPGPQSQVQFRKDVKLTPGTDHGFVALRQIRQVLHLISDKRVGCVPGTIDRNGEQDPLQVCALSPSQGVPVGAGPFGDANGTVILGTIDPSTFNDKVFHRFVRTGSSRTDIPFNLDTVVPTVEGANYNLLSAFDPSTDGGLIQIQTTHSIATNAVVGQRALLIDQITGKSASLCQVGESVALPSGDFDIASVLDTRVADGGLAYVTTFLQPPVGNVQQAILVKDASQAFDTGDAPIVASLQPGDSVETGEGPFAIANPNLLDAVDATGEALFFSSAGQSFTAFRGSVGDGESVQRLVGTGDATDAGDGSVVTSLQQGGGLSDTGAVLILSTQIVGNVASTKTCAYRFENPPEEFQTVASRKVLCVGDPLPGSRTVAALIGANAGNNGGGSLALLESDAAAGIRSAVLTFDSAGIHPIAEAGDVVTSEAVARTITEILLAPRTLVLEEKQPWLNLTNPGGASLNIEESAEIAVVPDVIERDQALAEADLAAAGLTVGTVVFAASDLDPAGATIDQFPSGGDRVPTGSAVDLTVSSGPAVEGDVDGDGDVDLDDLNAIRAARSNPAAGPDDPRDLDGDGTITGLDLRKAALLCTRPRCAAE